MEIDLSFFAGFLDDPASGSIAFLQAGGWLILFVPILMFLVSLFLRARRERKQEQTVRGTKAVLLALDFPRSNEQTPKAAENIFAQLAATLKDISWTERVLHGVLQERFSFEIASLGGYTQFFVWVPVEFRDLVEAGIYAQYPDAEIVEVNDYTNLAPAQFPDDEHELWGAELVFANDNVYPIRTYPYFEDSTTKEFKDPIAAVLEMLNKIQQNEQIWTQIVVSPVDDEWKEEGEKVVADLIGRKVETKPDAVSKTIGYAMKGLGGLSDLTRITAPASEGAPTKKTEKKEPESKMQHMTPGEMVRVQAIEEKISKIGFEVKIRLIYIAKKDVFHEGRGIAALIGVFNQFNTLNLNKFKAKKAIQKEESKTRFIWAYRRRRMDGIEKPIILNTEELATLFHFPIIGVKAPLVQRTEARRSEPPFSLPVV